MPMLKSRCKPPTQAKIGVSAFALSAVFLIVTQHQGVKNYTSTLSLLVLTAAISIFFLFVDPIRQPQSYHNFADKRAFLCSCHGYTDGFFLPPNERTRGFVIPNFGDVMSNLFILAGGVAGLFVLQYENDAEIDSIQQWELEVCLPILFYSTILISIGSAYYHWKPTDKSLVWDRLPMTTAFASIVCFMLEECTTFGFGKVILLPLIGTGVASIVYWRWTDDLRLYALVQFLPLMIIAMLLISADPKHGGKMYHQIALMLYVLAKYCEDRDYEIFDFTRQLVSGHSLKHILAGLASISIALAIKH